VTAPAPLKRFYTTVTVAPADVAGRFRLHLDGKPVKTPLKRDLDLAGARLAEAACAEWRAQGAEMDLASMPMTRLAMSVADHVAPRLDAVRQEALGFAGTDLLCYRAEGPERLAARQSEIWQPFLDWAAAAFGARLATGAGITAIPQPPEAIAALERVLAALGAEQLLVAHALTYRFGSLILAVAVVRSRASGAEALAASRLDEMFQAETWGGDAEAEARSARIAREVADLARFLSLLP